jgi:hypothetical protein
VEWWWRRTRAGFEARAHSGAGGERWCPLLDRHGPWSGRKRGVGSESVLRQMLLMNGEMDALPVCCAAPYPMWRVPSSPSRSIHSSAPGRGVTRTGLNGRSPTQNREARFGNRHVTWSASNWEKSPRMRCHFALRIERGSSSNPGLAARRRAGYKADSARESREPINRESKAWLLHRAANRPSNMNSCDIWHELK